jgi:4-hydroxy 2-oxovalerate aldolase
MGNYNLKLLDCTLRDGGYINNWNWGFQKAKRIIENLSSAGLDMIEVGFLRNVDSYNKDITVCNYIEELNLLVPDNNSKVIYSAMAMRSNYDINKLTEYKGKGIELIRVTAHDYDLQEGLKFARTVKEKGYKVSVNPINIMGYSDEQILKIIDEVNDILPYQFAIVDTFGSMKRRDLDRIVSLVDHNLDKSIRVALHLHENMSLSCCLAQNFLDKHLDRPISVDGSLMGIGRNPGNLPIELIADYVNDYADGNYDIDYIMDAIQDYIAPMHGNSKWGYTPAYFLSAKFNLHRNYAEYYLGKGDLTNRDINLILSRFEEDKKTVFDQSYAEMRYIEYKDSEVDDRENKEYLARKLLGSEILIIAPGSSLNTYKEKINDLIVKKSPIVISVNFSTDMFKTDYIFCSNNKRAQSIQQKNATLVFTSNITYPSEVVYVDYNSLSGSFEQGCNSVIMLLKLLKELGVENVYIAGADGYTVDDCNYFRSDMRSYAEHRDEFNIAVARAIKTLGINVKFVTPSKYER